MLKEVAIHLNRASLVLPVMVESPSMGVKEMREPDMITTSTYLLLSIYRFPSLGLLVPAMTLLSWTST
jgi:hypothetical protein